MLPFNLFILLFTFPFYYTGDLPLAGCGPGTHYPMIFPFFYSSVELSFLLHGQALTPSTLYIGYLSTFDLY
jgi:hypothetical protein